MLTRTLRRFTFNYPCPRNLREIMQMSLIEREGIDTIKTLWEEYHANRTENVAMIFTKEIFEQISSKTKESSMFILPVKRESGHFMMISQTQDNSLLFTSLENFQRNQIFSNPYFIFTTFEELKDTKGIILGRGDIIDGHLTREEAKELMKNFLMFHMNGDLYQQYVLPFNFDSQKFDYKKFCRNLDISHN